MTPKVIYSKDIPYTQILNIKSGPKTIDTSYSRNDRKAFEPIKPKETLTKLNELMSNPAKAEEYPNDFPVVQFRNERNKDKIDNIYELFYKEKKTFAQDQQNNYQNSVLPSKQRPTSMKGSYEEPSEAPQQKSRNYENKKTLERIGQQVLGPINSLPIEIPKEPKILPENSRNLQSEKNMYDNFNQRLDHLDRMRKKFELQRNFDDKQLISRFEAPIYVYKDDIERYKRALERRVLASKNTV